MDALALGIGVGYDLKGADRIKIKTPSNTVGELTFVIPDSREGWVESLKLLLSGYFNGTPIPIFDYSIVRPYGSLILGFGGTASGPGPLREMHENITGLFIDREGEFVSSVDIVDIVDFVAKCIVAGNSRRSATVALGSPNDSHFME